MQYSPLIQAIKKEIGFEPKQSDLCKILDIGRGTMSNRAKNDSKFSDDEIKKIEEFYVIKLDRDVSNISVELEYYPDVFGSCGNGCMVFSEAKEKLAVTKDIITNYSASNQYSIIVARGRSNEPTIMNEDKLVVEHVKDNAIIDNQLYVFSYEGQIYVKRLIKNIDELVIISDNPDKEVYRTQYVTKNNINNVNIIGKIVGLIRDKV